MATENFSPMSVRELLASYKRAITAEELAGVLAVSERLIFKKAKRGIIPSFRIGTAVRFDPKAVSEWISKQ